MGSFEVGGGWILSYVCWNRGCGGKERMKVVDDSGGQRSWAWLGRIFIYIRFIRSIFLLAKTIILDEKWKERDKGYMCESWMKGGDGNEKVKSWDGCINKEENEVKI